MPTCRQATRLQSQAIDGAAPIYRRPGLLLHLLACRWCRRYGTQIRFLRRLAHDHPESLDQAQPRNLSPEAKTRLKETLKQAGQ